MLFFKNITSSTPPTTATSMYKAVGTTSKIQASAYSTCLTKPLSRAKFNTQAVAALKAKQSQKSTNNINNNTPPQPQKQQRRHYIAYYYPFPKIPRPKRNALYYNVTGISIVGTLTRKFSTASTRRYKNAGVIANTKRLFRKRKYSTSSSDQQSQQLQQPRLSKRKRLRNLFTLTSISIIFFGVVSRYHHQNIEELDDEDEEIIRPTSLGLFWCQFR
ncbi:unnamed protein product [Ambrosiozyma monospora]|uniref:Unnamed protein product n=1 Tax=Ambrosiozyma monospora TaxID=43982 RepID=A0ACB5TUW6_AMBMO|nr:unnamed protein product [Ambrosiozyma monospora]